MTCNGATKHSKEAACPALTCDVDGRLHACQTPVCPQSPSDLLAIKAADIKAE